MNDERLRDAYERGLPYGGERAPLDDLTGERLRKLVEQEGSEAERLHTVDTLLSTAEGRQDLDIVWAAARAARPPRRWPRWWRLAAAAAVVIATVPGVWLATRERAPVMRGHASPIMLVAPLGPHRAEAASRFVWRAVSGAERYTLVVVDTAGAEVFALETQDTAVRLPDSVRLEPGRSYLWWVQARTALGESITAVTERLSVVRE